MSLNKSISAIDLLKAANELLLNNELPKITAPISKKSSPYNAISFNIDGLNPKNVIKKTVEKLSEQESIPENIVEVFKKGTGTLGDDVECFDLAFIHKTDRMMVFRTVLDANDNTISIQLGNADIFKN